MKKTLIALAAIAATSVALATPPSAQTSVAGVATSGVAGSASSFSNVNGIGQSTFHGSFSKAQNNTVVGGSVNAGQDAAGVATNAITTGSTQTGAIGGSLSNPGGFGGLGGAGAAATQYGFGNVAATADKMSGQVKYNTEAKSNVAVGTYSTAGVTNSGAALSGSAATAQNTTVTNVSSLGNATTHAAGHTIGADLSATYGTVIGSDETISAGGALQMANGGTASSAQGGSFEAEITKSFVVTNAAPAPHVPTTPAPSHPSNPKNDNDKDKNKNNGWGNGDQDAPGKSGPKNNAENGPNSPRGR